MFEVNIENLRVGIFYNIPVIKICFDSFKSNFPRACEGGELVQENGFSIFKTKNSHLAEAILHSCGDPRCVVFNLSV